jgi:U3 small nucleolar RNA-associated protein 11
LLQKFHLLEPFERKTEKMSSMRNAIPRRAHRERSQPHSRAKLGLLEKRKDYVLRAQDYKRKRSVLKRLAEKAAERNPDEFYFSMVRERTEKGVAIAERPESKTLSVKEVRPLKMQDASYLRTIRSIERRKIEKLRGMVTNGVTGKARKILFAENEEEGICSNTMRLI